LNPECEDSFPQFAYSNPPVAYLILRVAYLIPQLSCLYDKCWYDTGGQYCQAPNQYSPDSSQVTLIACRPMPPLVTNILI
jgi:hypothetical protein